MLNCKIIVTWHPELEGRHVQVNVPSHKTGFTHTTGIFDHIGPDFVNGCQQISYDITVGDMAGARHIGRGILHTRLGSILPTVYGQTIQAIRDLNAKGQMARELGDIRYGLDLLTHWGLGAATNLDKLLLTLVKLALQPEEVPA